MKTDLKKGNSTMLEFVDDASNAIVVPAHRFLGVDTTDGTDVEVFFQISEGTSDADKVVLAINDNDGLGFKRVCQALANAMRPNKAGKHVVVANTLTGKFIHPDITEVTAVS